jgi:hypothetical protein
MKNAVFSNPYEKRTSLNLRSGQVWGQQPTERPLNVEMRSSKVISFGPKCWRVRAFCASRLALRELAAGLLAERVGFEPTVRFHVHTLSKRAP